MKISVRNIRKEDNDDFIGIKLITSTTKEGSVEAIFPLGYHLSVMTDDDKKKEIFNLLCIIKKYSKSDHLSNVPAVSFKEDDFPFHAYVTVIRLFMSMGYYMDNDIQYISDYKGKINWRKTIKHNKPVIQDNSVVFTEFVIRNSHLNSDNIITKIHQWCVYEAFAKFGWLWTSFVPDKPAVDCTKNAAYFATILRSKLAKTFKDRNKELFVACIAMLECKRNENDREFYFGSTHFQTIWEGLIDQAYGISSAEKAQYFPPASWHLVKPLSFIEKTNALRPDTIMDIKDDNLFVLDAKYYSFVLNPHAIPSAADIHKQVCYGEYAHQKCSRKKVYNAFIMPYDFETNVYKLEISEGAHYTLIGSAYLMHICKPDTDKTYKRVLGILIDTKWLMQRSMHANKTELAKYIISAYRSENGE
jgi:hypothetical protein